MPRSIRIFSVVFVLIVVVVGFVFVIYKFDLLNLQKNLRNKETSEVYCGGYCDKDGYFLENLVLDERENSIELSFFGDKKDKVSDYQKKVFKKVLSTIDLGEGGYYDINMSVGFLDRGYISIIKKIKPDKLSQINQATKDKLIRQEGSESSWGKFFIVYEFKDELLKVGLPYTKAFEEINKNLNYTSNDEYNYNVEKFENLRYSLYIRNNFETQSSASMFASWVNWTENPETKIYQNSDNHFKHPLLNYNFYYDKSWEIEYKEMYKDATQNFDYGILNAMVKTGGHDIININVRPVRYGTEDGFGYFGVEKSDIIERENYLLVRFGDGLKYTLVDKNNVFKKDEENTKGYYLEYNEKYDYYISKNFIKLTKDLLDVSYQDGQWGKVGILGIYYTGDLKEESLAKLDKLFVYREKDFQTDYEKCVENMGEIFGAFGEKCKIGGQIYIRGLNEKEVSLGVYKSEKLSFKYDKSWQLGMDNGEVFLFKDKYKLTIKQQEQLTTTQCKDVRMEYLIGQVVYAGADIRMFDNKNKSVKVRKVFAKSNSPISSVLEVNSQGQIMCKLGNNVSFVSNNMAYSFYLTKGGEINPEQDDIYFDNLLDVINSVYLGDYDKQAFS